MTTDLTGTIRVRADGTIERLIDVPHRAANIRGDNRIVAAPPHHAKGARYRGTYGVPRGVNLNITTPHDCANHVPE